MSFTGLDSQNHNIERIYCRIEQGKCPDFYLVCLLELRVVFINFVRSQTICGVAQLVEHQLPKLRVAGSSPVSRSVKIRGLAL